MVSNGGGSADPVRWAKIHDIFHAALTLDPCERAAFVAAACHGDAALHAEISTLLASDLQAGDFIEQPAAAILASARASHFAPRLSVGTSLGRYHVEEFLGVGGTSEVYRAHDTLLGRTVALKLITDPRDPDAGSRLLSEAQHASILNHPHICALYEAEHGTALPFIVLEFIEGPTLHQVLKTRLPSVEEVVLWARQIAAALEHAHRRGVIHRDLKSANVALAPDGSVKILDFGLSRRMTSGDTAQSPAEILKSASVAGTLTHMAPEVLRGEPPDARVDLWAFGVMLYELLTGRVPFKRATTLQTAEAILGAVPEPLPAPTPPELKRVVERCLSKDPRARFRTATELRAALDELGPVAHLHRATRSRYIATALVAVATAGALYSAWTLSTPRVPIVAVSPLEGGSGDPKNEFFADGVTEALIEQLGRIDGLRVIAQSTSMRSKGDATPVRQLTQAAGANRVVEGSVFREADRVRLSARVVDPATNRVLWSQSYERGAREIQALYATVAAAIAAAIHVQLNAEDAQRFAAVRAVDPAVYESYLKGRFYWNQRTPQSIRLAIEHFEAALELDPTYAPAYAALADCYNQLGTVMVGGGSPRQWRPRAAAAAIKALQIDAGLAEAHATLGYVRHYDWQWEEAEKSFRRAIELNPNNPLAHIWYANFLCSRRRLDEAVHEVAIARDLDPLSLIVNTNVGWVLFMARRFESAIDQFERTLLIDPSYQQAQSRLASSYLHAKRFDDALALSEKIAEATNERLGSLVPVEQVKMLAGQPNRFEEMLEQLVAREGSQRYVSPGAIANYFFSLRHRDDDGFRWLQRSFEERTNNIAYLAVEPVYDRVRNDPRFTAIYQAVGLP
jgi:serine/threonine-protein kinase